MRTRALVLISIQQWTDNKWFIYQSECVLIFAMILTSIKYLPLLDFRGKQVASAKEKPLHPVKHVSHSGSRDLLGVARRCSSE